MFNIFSWVKRERLADVLLNAEHEEGLRLTPIADIGRHVVTCAIKSQEQTKSLIELNDEGEILKRGFLLFCEHLYFFFFIAHWSAKGVVSRRKLAEMLSLMRETIPPVAVASRFDSLPMKIADAMHREFVEKLDRAESEYKQIVDNGEAVENRFENLLKHHAEMVVRLCGREKDWPVLGPLIVDTIWDTLKAADFNELANRISAMQEGSRINSSLRH